MLLIVEDTVQTKLIIETLPRRGFLWARIAEDLGGFFPFFLLAMQPWICWGKICGLSSPSE